MNLQPPERERCLVVDAEYTVESTGNQTSEPIVHLFCRDSDGNRRQIEVAGFRPYFMLSYDTFVERTTDVINDRHVVGVRADLGDFAERTDLDADLDDTSPESVADYLTDVGSCQVFHDPSVDEALDGTQLVQILTVEPSHVGKIREHFDRTWEADIPFERRFLIDSGIYRGIEIPSGATRVRYENWDGHSTTSDLVQEIEPAEPPNIRPRMLVTDIEVATHGGGVPDVTKANNEITAITAYDNYEGQYAAWILEHESWDDPDEDTFEDDVAEELGIDLDTFTIYDHEGAMIEHFVEWVNDRDFDIMTAWNTDFDYPYLVNRAYSVSAYSVREWDVFGKPGAWKDENDNLKAKMDGRVVWDSLEAYKKTQFRDMRSYSLEYVAQTELGMGKEDLENDLDEAWAENPVAFMRYNVRDVQAVVQIQDAVELLDLYDNMREVTGAGYTTCHHNGPMLDTLFLRQAHEEGIALTTNYEPEQGDYHGAHVFEPVPGKHETVVYPDLACFTPDTEVVTPTGIRSITDLEVGDVVYSIDPDTGSVTTKPVVETHEYPDYDDEIVDIQSTRTDFRVTPNHQMLVESQSGAREFMRADRLDSRSYHKLVSEWSFDEHSSGIETVDITSFLDSDEYDVVARYDEHGHAYRSKLPDGCTKKRANYHEGFVFDGDTFESYQDEIESLSSEILLTHPDGTGSTFRPYTFDGDAFVELLGWFITEGSVYYPDEDKTASVKIAQENDDGRKQIRSVFEDLGIEPSVDTNGFVIGSEIYGLVLEQLCGSGSKSTQIPEFIFEEASYRQKELLFETLMEGDGYNDIYYTSSKDLSEDFARLCVETGRKPIVRCRRDDQYEISVHDTNDGINSDTHVSTSEADDGVYCVTVADNHTLLAGRNGRFQWVGQSLYPHILWTLNISPETMYTSREAYRDAGFTDDQVFTAYIDDREWKIMSSGETVEPSTIDRDKYKGVHDETGSRKKKTSQGFDGIFDPLDPDHPKSKTEIYFVKPDVKEGFIRNTVDLLVDLKYRYKGQGDMYSAVKRVTNSIYGVLGDSASGGRGFRLFDWRLAEAITLGGQMVIQFTADTYVDLIDDYAESAGYEPDSYLVGGDTDSVQTAIPQAPDYDTALSWAQQASEVVSGELYDEFMHEEFDVVPGEDEHKMDVEIESLASGLFFSRDWDRDDEVAVKKRYAQHEIWDEDDGWLDTGYEAPDDPDDRSELKYRNDVSLDDYEDGGPLASYGEPTDHVDITGFEYVRSDSAIITAEAQERVLTDILLADDVSDRLYRYLSDLRDDIVDGSVPIEKLGRPKGISNELDDYGWKTVAELESDTNYTVTADDEDNGGRYVATPGPTYRGRKYAVDHFDWEDGDQKKCTRLYVEQVRGDEYPAAYRYDEFPRDDRPDSPEVGQPVDAITVEYVDRVPDDFVFDRETMMEKELKDKIQPIIRTIGEDWDGIVGQGRQVGLDAF